MPGRLRLLRTANTTELGALAHCAKCSDRQLDLPAPALFVGNGDCAQVGQPSVLGMPLRMTYPVALPRAFASYLASPGH